MRDCLICRELYKLLAWTTPSRYLRTGLTSRHCHRWWHIGVLSPLELPGCRLHWLLLVVSGFASDQSCTFCRPEKLYRSTQSHCRRRCETMSYPLLTLRQYFHSQVQILIPVCSLPYSARVSCLWYDQRDLFRGARSTPSVYNCDYVNLDQWQHYSPSTAWS